MTPPPDSSLCGKQGSALTQAKVASVLRFEYREALDWMGDSLGERTCCRVRWINGYPESFTVLQSAAGFCPLITYHQGA